MSSFDDFRIGARSLRRTPGFTAIAVLTLILGIGANAAIFSVFSALLLKPLDYRDPAHLVQVFERNPEHGWSYAGVTGPVFAEWMGKTRAFDGLAAFTARNAALTGSGEPLEVAIGVTGAGVFEVLGKTAVLGRAFSAEEYQSGGVEVALLGERFWISRFGADSTLIGRSVVLDGRPRVVVGVMAAGGELTSHYAAWIPLPNRYEDLSPGAHNLTVIGRLRPGMPLAGVEADLGPGMAAAMARAPAAARGWLPQVVPLVDAVVGPAGVTVSVLLGAVGLVLLIACVNVANLTLVRAHGREREIAVRAAVGASRWRIARGLIAESVVVAVLGAIGGLFAAMWAMDAIVAVAPEGFPRVTEVRLDWRVMGFTVAVTGFAVVLFGVVPAFRASRTNLQVALRSGVGSGGRGRGRDALAVAEVALALMLTVGAGLLLRSLGQLRGIELGYQPAGTVVLDLDLTSDRYEDADRRLQLVQETESLIRALPGVVSVGTTRALPLESGGPDSEFDVAGRTASDANARGWAFYTPVSPRYHEAMGTRLQAGRFLSAADDSKAAPMVVVVNETLAGRYWPGESPIGARIRFSAEQEAEIVGVVADLRQRNLADPIRPAIFVPFAHAPQTQLSMVVRVDGDPGSILPALRRVVWVVDPALPIEHWSMVDLMTAATSRPRFNAALLGLFAGLAVALAVVGVYGVISFGVSLRRREIGVRMALGASRGAVIGMVVRKGVVIAGLGVAVGLAGALLAGQLLSRLLYGVSPADPFSLAAGAAAVAVAIVVASVVPARQAAAGRVTDLIRGE